MSRLNVFFPNLTSLELKNVTLNEPKPFAMNFTQLKHFKLYNEKNTIEKSTVVEMLRVNPQLEKLVLKQRDYDVDLIQSISENLLVLEELEMWMPRDRFLSFGVSRIYFESVEKFTLNQSHHTKNSSRIPFEFKKLQELALEGFNEYKTQILTFILENKGLHKLRFMPLLDDIDDMKYDDLLEIASSLPNLTDMEFCADLFAQDDLIAFITDHEMLKKVQLLFTVLLNSSPFKDSIPNEWSIDEQWVDADLFISLTRI